METINNDTESIIRMCFDRVANELMMIVSGNLFLLLDFCLIQETSLKSIQVSCLIWWQAKVSWVEFFAGLDLLWLSKSTYHFNLAFQTYEIKEKF